MTLSLPALTPVEETLWITLTGRAFDSRQPDPILGDTMADALVRKTGYTNDKLRWTKASCVEVAHRAKKLDEVARRFIARHPDAIGIDLGAGLDTRALRIDTPPTVDWYDVDFPDVVAARRQLIPDRPHVHTIGADLTDPAWLQSLPADRPAVIVADGLMAFLAEADMISLLRWLTDHLRSGEIAFNVYNTFTVRAAKLAPSARFLVPLFKSAGFGSRDIVHWNPELTLMEEIMLVREPEVAQYPPALRLWTRMAALSTSLSRLGTVVAHYRF
ncbi:class I SAM-dependent methyltransferase [Nonomuraea sp. FMUSA5-5]|uniref:Class I SAM-dependent methyltransferase n=1 Tax=Nonomuraea composti TaxID=2720023 RepID=A0ABX1BD85_9ACTN|nr:class I SAM-dependent methyltransferase [Nonomuraea sp. FMUSA5-5]NJP94772.1 class I SAM-dependent methyltransferase [Nonomuraea sp. FMUSA5-5]